MQLADDARRGGASLLQEEITERTLRLVDRQIGTGEAPSVEEWQALRALAPTAEGALLVTELQAIVQRFDEQIRAKYASNDGSVDVGRLRQGLAHLVRAIVHRKVGTPAPVRPASPDTGEVE